MIAQWQIEQFHQQGFLVVEGVLSPDEIAALQQDLTVGSKRAAATPRCGRDGSTSPRRLKGSRAY
ncbi:hypothetical protein UA70_07285, partial [Raoultella planticola]